jgi:hypothetical protein
MKKSLHHGWFIVSLCVGLFVVGCVSSPSYFRVTDLQSGKEYYTQKVDHLASGAVVVNDTRTDSTITLQNSQVKKISSDEYKTGVAVPVSQSSSTAAVAPAAEPSSAPTGTK